MHLCLHFAAANLTDKDIPTPQLDNNKNPKELTVPLACPTTFKVDSPEAQDALTQYYKVVMKCLTMTTQHKIQVFRFNRRFYDWLTQAVSVLYDLFTLSEQTCCFQFVEYLMTHFKLNLNKTIVFVVG